MTNLLTFTFIMIIYTYKQTKHQKDSIMLNEITVIKNKKQTTFKGEELEEICAKNVLEYNTNLDHYKPSDFGYESYLALVKAIIDGKTPYLTEDACEEYGEEDCVRLNDPVFKHYDEEEFTLRGVIWSAFENSRALFRAIGA